jgi:AcrR family transcriptional regulator
VEAGVGQLSGAAQPAEDGAATRRRLLYEASILFARASYSGTSTREIAAAVGVRQPSLFYHFSSKAEIMHLLLEQSLVPPAKVAQRLAGETDRPAGDRLYEYMLFDTRHILGSPYHLGGLEADDVMESAEFVRWRRLRDRLRKARGRIVAEGMQSGEFVDVGVPFATGALTGLVVGVTKAAKPGEGDQDGLLSLRIANFAVRALLSDPARIEEIAARVEPEAGVLDESRTD